MNYSCNVLRIYFLYWVVHSGKADSLITQYIGWEVPPTHDDSRLALITFMSIVSSAKFSIWTWFISTNPFTFSICIMMQILRTIIESITIVNALCNPHPFGPLEIGAVLLFVVGIFLELGSETQRKIWKSRPENKGKPYTKGLFSLIQHINYTGFLLWNVSFLLAAGSVKGALIFGVIQGLMFNLLAIPDLQRHNKKKYGKAFETYSARTPKFTPFC